MFVCFRHHGQKQWFGLGRFFPKACSVWNWKSCPPYISQTFLKCLRSVRQGTEMYSARNKPLPWRSLKIGHSSPTWTESFANETCSLATRCNAAFEEHPASRFLSSRKMSLRLGAEISRSTISSRGAAICAYSLSFLWSLNGIAKLLEQIRANTSFCEMTLDFGSF